MFVDATTAHSSVGFLWRVLHLYWVVSVSQVHYGLGYGESECSAYLQAGDWLWWIHIGFHRVSYDIEHQPVSHHYNPPDLLTPWAWCVCTLLWSLGFHTVGWKPWKITPPQKKFFECKYSILICKNHIKGPALVVFTPSLCVWIFSFKAYFVLFFSCCFILFGQSIFTYVSCQILIWDCWDASRE